MLQVVCRVKSHVYSADVDSDIDATRQAVYDKLKNTDTKTRQDIVRYIAKESEDIIREIKGTQPAGRPGFRVKFLDGHCIKATEHRRQVLRDTQAGAGPGTSLVVFKPELGIATEVCPCENGQAQECSGWPSVLETVVEDDGWVADRHFCTLSFIFGIHQKKAFFILRQPANTPCQGLVKKAFIKDTEAGQVHEQQAIFSDEGKEMMVRRIVVKGTQTTRHGDKELRWFTNLPKSTAKALIMAHIYRQRGSIETVFQKLEKSLNSEINTLGYPKAALLGFCRALVAFNIDAIVMATIQASDPEKNSHDEISDDDVAEKRASTDEGMNLILEPED